MVRGGRVVFFGNPRGHTIFSSSSLIVQKAILEVSNLCIRRGNVLILDHISWRIERGQHWAMLGANGSGKTSLLSALAGYLNATSGEIEVLGRKFGQTDWRELRKEIGLVSSSVRRFAR